ncbi:MAG: Gfo/Idh/MocA family protein [Anaerolineae bacterium]|jgi:predicted dehydrogenase|nr:Gfo/Idh/MocA family oxidoreductase [Chloroflexota bacterium]
MKRIRYGIVGTGGMGSGHARTMQRVDECQLAAVCDIQPNVAEEVGEEYNVPYFTDYHDLIDLDSVDAIIVATPHYFHPEVAIYAMERGKPVISEKPIAVTVSAADAMVEAAERTGTPFAVMHQRRSEPVWQAAHKIVSEGRLGELYRTMMVYADFRSQAYYNSAGWRATWAGEGGGVLINQSPHSIDLYTWLGGLPSRVTAVTATRGHVIEVEDVASAMLEYPNGALGYMYCCTNEAPSTDILELSGERAKLQVIGNQLRLWEIPRGVRGFSDSSTEMWTRPEVREVPVELPECEHGHIAIIRNMARHMLYDEPLIAPGVEGRNTVEMINATILSGRTGKPVSVPVDRPAYDAFLAELQATSNYGKKATGPDLRITDNVHH